VRIDIVAMQEDGPASIVPAPTMFQMMREKESHPLVRQAVELFDAEVIRVDLPRASGNQLPPAGPTTSTSEGAS
jgi:hypothetical protein